MTALWLWLGERTVIKSTPSTLLLPVAISPDEPCIGGEIKVIFSSTNGGEFIAIPNSESGFASDKEIFIRTHANMWTYRQH